MTTLKGWATKARKGPSKPAKPKGDTQASAKSTTRLRGQMSPLFPTRDFVAAALRDAHLAVRILSRPHPSGFHDWHWRSYQVEKLKKIIEIMEEA